MTSKIAVIGTVGGNIRAVFGKLATLHAKNNFSFVIITGSLFADDTGDEEADSQVQDLVHGKIEIPLPTYFALGTKPLPASVIEKLRDDGEVCSNLFFLGRRTTIKTSEGLRIVTLSGALQDSSKETTAPAIDEYTPAYSITDAKSLKGAKTADILVTTHWPRGIELGSALGASQGASIKEQQCVADLALSLKPRYHFSVSPSFYEREPFFYPPDPENPGFSTTRFISLACYGNKDKQKWIYAFNLENRAGPLADTPPAGATACPFTSTMKLKRTLPDQGQAFSRFAGSGGNHGGHRDKRSRHHAEPLPSECFFCLSNANVATHMVGSIGDSSYLTTAKGPLSTDTTFPPLDGLPGHMLVIPLEHTSSIAAIADKETRGQTLSEMHKYRLALHSMVSRTPGEGSAEGDDGEISGKRDRQSLGSVTWSVSRAAGIHAHWQFMPVHQHTVDKGLVEAAFMVHAENESYPRFTVKRRRPSTSDCMDEDEASESEDHFRVWISPPTTEEDVSEGETVLTLPLDSSFRFDLQFGRKVMAKLLGLESRSDWRACQQSEEDETADAEAFKQAFKEHDFSLED